MKNTRNKLHTAKEQKNQGEFNKKSREKKSRIVKQCKRF